MKQPRAKQETNERKALYAFSDQFEALVEKTAIGYMEDDPKATKTAAAMKALVHCTAGALYAIRKDVALCMEMGKRHVAPAVVGTMYQCTNIDCNHKFMRAGRRLLDGVACTLEECRCTALPVDFLQAKREEHIARMKESETKSVVGRL